MITAKLWAMLVAIAVYFGSCLGDCVGLDRDAGKGDPELTKWAADSDAYWDNQQAKDDARNAELDRKAEVKRREGIYGAIDEYRAAHHESPRTTGDVRQDWREVREGHEIRVVSQAVEDDFLRRHWEATRRRWQTAEPRESDDADKEAEEAARYGR